MNTLGSLLVHMDASPRSEARIALAQALLARCATGSQAPGHIEAVYCSAPAFSDVPLAFSEGGGAGGLAFLNQLYEQRYQEAKARFNRRNATSVPLMAWHEVCDAPHVPAVVGRALYADLLVLGQHLVDEESTLSTPSDFVESVLIDSGRAAIVVPCTFGVGGKVPPVGQQVLLAWKPTREAARAVAAALPLLQRCARVHLVVEAGKEPALHDLENWLRSHEVEARFERHAPLGSEAPGEGLLSLAADTGADLLVMGCYGHSRLREWVLGGATRTVLSSMTLPVLMAH